MSQFNKQQIEQVKEIVNQILEQRDAKKEKMYVNVCNEIKIDDAKFKKDMESLSSWRKKMDAAQSHCESRIKLFKNNTEKLQQFYDKFNG